MQFDRLHRREFITLLGGAAADSACDTAVYMADLIKHSWRSRSERFSEQGWA
jgi:hypothetical protein